MKNLFAPEAKAEVVARLQHLTEDSPRQWGKMNVSQMMAHCSMALEVATGERHLPRIFIGRLLGPFIKSAFTNATPLRKNTPTDKTFVMAGEHDFRQEKERLIQLIGQFHEAGEAGCTTHPHPFFGKLTAQEWAIGMYKHLDHHLRQFNT
jgi:hypothetical protein